MAPKRRLTTSALDDVTKGLGQAAPSGAHLDDIDAERRDRMARNAAALAAIGVANAAKDLSQAIAAKKNQQPRRHSSAAVVQGPQCSRGEPRGPRLRRQSRVPPRRSHRLAGRPAPDFVELDDDGNPVRGVGRGDGDGGGDGDSEEGDGELLDLIGKGAARVKPAVKVEEMTAEQQAALEARRCASRGRGRVYDSALGLTCHFCRQKMLCSEEGCGRCSARNAGAECLGKSSCPGCRSANGIFCRACLWVRYGQVLEKVRADPDWLCPHCYEKKHGSWRLHGWFCNSSICMRKQGRMPTGIAIHTAQERGYTSVAHMLQATVLKMAKNGAAGKQSAADAAASQNSEDGRNEKSEDGSGPGNAVGGMALADATVELV